MKNISRKLILALSLLAAGCGAAQSDEESTADKAAQKKEVEVKIVSATAILAPFGRNVATGLVQFVEDGGKVKVNAEFHGLFAGKYTFHVNETGRCGIKKKNDEGEGDAGPTRDEEEAGLGQVVADLGLLEPDEKRTAISEFEKENLSFTGWGSLIDKTVIVCAGEEGLAEGSSADACQKVACGVIHSD